MDHFFMFLLRISNIYDVSIAIDFLKKWINFVLCIILVDTWGFWMDRILQGEKNTYIFNVQWSFTLSSSSALFIECQINNDEISRLVEWIVWGKNQLAVRLMYLSASDMKTSWKHLYVSIKKPLQQAICVNVKHILDNMNLLSCISKEFVYLSENMFLWLPFTLYLQRTNHNKLE